MMCCYYPTRTIAIDDDVDFLRMMTQHLGISDCVSYSSPHKAIQSLKDQKSFQRLQSRILKTTFAPEAINSNPEDHAFLINMRGLHEEIYSIERFQDVSVLIVDYHMDELSGIEVCETLSKHPAKKILLTGGIDKEKVAIEAFNKGIIHRFINKSDPNFPTQLKQAISVLKESYFLDLTSAIFPYTSNTNILQHPSYVNFLRNLQCQFEAVEYYQFETTGSGILLDAKGSPVWFIVKHESEMENYEKLARDQDGSEKIIKALANRELLPFFFSDQDYENSVANWNQFLYPAQKLQGLSEYYYTIFKGHIRDNLVQEKIVPYASHNKLLNNEIHI